MCARVRMGIRSKEIIMKFFPVMNYVEFYNSLDFLLIISTKKKFVNTTDFFDLTVTGVKYVFNN